MAPKWLTSTVQCDRQSTGQRDREQHKKQVQTYLRLTGCKLGYLLNYGEALMKAGITRCVNGLEE